MWQRAVEENSTAITSGSHLPCIADSKSHQQSVASDQQATLMPIAWRIVFFTKRFANCYTTAMC